LRTSKTSVSVSCCLSNATTTTAFLIAHSRGLDVVTPESIKALALKMENKKQDSV